MSRSLHRQLFWPLLLGVLGVGMAAGLLLYLGVRSEFLEQFDASLAEQGRSLGSFVKLTDGGRVEMDVDDDPLSQFAPGRHAEYFEIWLPDGSVLARSPSLASDHLPRQMAAPQRPLFRDVRLPDGRPGRAIIMSVAPRWDEDDSHGNAAASATARAAEVSAVQLALARDREELDEALATLLTALMLTAVLMSLIVPLIVSIVVRRGLRPLNALASHAAAIDAASLGSRFATRDLPAELTPICAKLNELLHRLDEAFQRERRFTADAAHELRTPIAELRSLAEVALRTNPEPAAAAAYFQDALNIAVQMERLVIMLLGLARGQAKQQQVARESCDLAQLVNATWKTLREPAEKRRLRLDILLPETAEVISDRGLLSAVLRNVMSNAVDHSPAGGEVVCRLEKEDVAWTLELRNSNDSLTSADLAHLGEPFWRHSAARGDQAHAGLGLALVRRYCDILGIILRVDLPSPTCFRIALTVGDDKS